MTLTRFDDARVVVVDDSPPDAALLDSLLRQAGLRDLHLLTQARPQGDLLTRLDPDLVLLDLHPDHPDRFALLDEITQAAAGTYLPVVALTEHNATDVAHRALSAGARDFLTKPFDTTETLLRIENLLETRYLYQRLRRANARLGHDLGGPRLAHSTDEATRQATCDTVLSALARNAFHMVFQPIIDLHTQATVAYEALARFDLEPRRSPEQWFADAAEAGLGYALELQALSQALDALPHLPTTTLLSVNISAETLLHPRLLTLIDPDLAPRLVLELTERLPVEDYGAICRPLARLRARGVQLALDDTGAGYDSLRHLRVLVPDMIKLHQPLVRGIDADPARRALTAALVTFAAETNTQLIAKGIETPAELHTLTTLGVRFGQGYLLQRPQPLP